MGSRPNTAQADPDRTLGPGRALSRGGAVRRRRHHARLPRAAGHDLLPPRTPGFPRPAARLARVRALLHPGDHRDAAPGAGEPVRAVQPARSGAADADADAGRARPQCPRRLSRQRSARGGGTADGRRARAYDRGARRPRRTGRHVHAGGPAAPRGAPRAAAEHAPGRGDDHADRDAARVRDGLRGHARDGRARRAPGGRGGRRRAARRGQRARPLRAATRVDAAGHRGPARRRLDRQAEACGRGHPAPHAEPARARAWPPSR